MTQSEPRFVLEPTAALLDEEISIKIAGGDPGDQVEIRSQMEWNETLYESMAVFESTNNVIDLSIHTPCTGSYDGVDPMDLLTSMTQPR